MASSPTTIITTIASADHLVVYAGVSSLLLLLIFVYLRHAYHSNYASTLPGPKRYPIVGNLFQMPSEGSHYKFAEWGKIYGEVIGLRLFGRNILVINSRQAIQELMQKRGNIYCNRPDSPLFNDWGGFSFSMTGMPFGKEVQHRRRLISQSLLSKEMWGHYEDHMHKEALQLARRIVHSPDKLLPHIDRLAGATIMRIAFGYEAEEENDQWIKLGQDMNYAFRKVEVAAGTHPVEIFPILANLPQRLFGAKLARELASCRAAISDLVHVPYAKVKAKIDGHTATPSMMKYLVDLNRLEDGAVNHEYAIKTVMAESFAAGADTSEAILKTFILAMITFPEVQHRAQAYLDAITQGERLPKFSDRSALPYIEAVMKETLRWKPVVPLAFPHATTEDDYYKGYFIPKGTTVIPNAWNCLHDEADFPEPEEFRPERFTDGQVLFSDVVEPRDFAFGFGRRVCPGRHLGEATIWITIATLLFMFEFSPAKDEKTGQDVLPDLEYWDSFAVSFPKPFECTITPRSKQRVLVLENTFEALQADASKKED